MGEHFEVRRNTAEDWFEGLWKPQEFVEMPGCVLFVSIC